MKIHLFFTLLLYAFYAKLLFFSRLFSITKSGLLIYETLKSLITNRAQTYNTGNTNVDICDLVIATF